MTRAAFLGLICLLASCSAPQDVETEEEAVIIGDPNMSEPIRPQARPEVDEAQPAEPAPEAQKDRRLAGAGSLVGGSGSVLAGRSAARASGQVLGTTVASLGSPSEQGYWLKTPLVSDEARGRVTYAGSGRSIEVTLIPIAGPATAGSRISLAALQGLGAPIAGLNELTVSLLR